MAEPTAASAAPRPPGPVEDAAAQAERIVLSAAAVIERADSFSVRFRQKARFDTRVLVGTGRYVQAGRGEDQRFRFDSTLTADTETFELTEVSDGLFCWTYRRDGGNAPSLQRVDVRRVRGRLAELGAADAADGAAYLGGLQRVIRLLRHWFRCTGAAPDEIDGQPVWMVDAQWRPEMLAVALPELGERAAAEAGIAPSDLPDGVPWGVRIAIGRTDLVPRRIEWLAIPGRRPVGNRPLETIAAIDFDDIQVDAAVDPTVFFYQPAGEGLIDVTEMTVGTLGLMR